METEEEFSLACSDEELKNDFVETPNGWEPKPVDILWIFEKISKEKVIPLEWKSEYGLRPPTPTEEETESEEEVVSEKVEIAGFDFDDEPSAPKLTPRRNPGTAVPKGSAKKKTTSFENVLASVRRQKKLEEKIRREKK